MENTVIQKPCSLVDPKLEVSQGNNARKVISEVYAFFVLQCIVNTRRMSQPDMESIFTKIIYEIFWS